MLNIQKAKDYHSCAYKPVTSNTSGFITKSISLFSQCRSSSLPSLTGHLYSWSICDAPQATGESDFSSYHGMGCYSSIHLEGCMCVVYESMCIRMCLCACVSVCYMYMCVHVCTCVYGYVGAHACMHACRGSQKKVCISLYCSEPYSLETGSH